MRWAKAEIAEQLTGLRQVVRAMRKRREILDIQMATQGLQTPPQILIEIETLTEHISAREKEIEQLEMHAVEDQISIGEAELRALIIATWNTPYGRPTVAGAAHLERERLRLGVSPEQAAEHQRSVRSALAEEILLEINLANLFSNDPARVIVELERIVRAFRLDANRAFSILQPPDENRPYNITPSLFSMINNRVWSGDEERRAFLDFASRLANQWPQLADNGELAQLTLQNRKTA